MLTNSKRYLWLGVMFCLFALLFTILYYLDLIKTLDLFLCVVYVAYFVGLALMYNGAYNRAKERTKSTLLNFIFGAIFMILAIGLLIYGLITETIVLF